MGCMIWGLTPGRGEIFCTPPDWLRSPPSLLYNGYQVISDIKLPGHGINYQPSSNSEVKERV